MNFDFLQALAPFGQTQHVIAGLQEAGRQQQQLDEAKRQHQAEMAMKQAEFQNRQQQQQYGNSLDLLRNGATPATPGSDGQFYNPSAGGPAAPGMLGVSAASLTPFAPGRVVTPPGGTQAFYQPTQDEQAQTGLNEKLKATKAVNEQQLNSFGIPITHDMATADSGLKEGQLVLPEKYAAIENAQARMKNATTKAFPGKPGKADALDEQMQLRQKQAEKLGLKGRDLAAYILTGKYAEFTPAETHIHVGTGDQTGNSRAVDVRQSMGEINKLEEEERKLHSTRNKLGALMGNGKLYMDEHGKVSPIEKMTSNPDEQKALQAEMKQRYDDATADVAKVIQKKNQLYGSIGKPVDVSTDQAKQALQDKPAAGKPPAAAQAGAKQAKPLTDPQVAQSYIQKAGGDKAKARRLAQADGWSF